jgi:hypothetical protein
MPQMRLHHLCAPHKPQAKTLPTTFTVHLPLPLPASEAHLDTPRPTMRTCRHQGDTPHAVPLNACQLPHHPLQPWPPLSPCAHLLVQAGLPVRVAMTALKRWLGLRPWL